MAKITMDGHEITKLVLTPASGASVTKALVATNSYGTADEGKVVSNGALKAQTSQNITTNGTYDTTDKNSVVVDVSATGDNMYECDVELTTGGNSNFPMITHNLHTQKIAVLIYPKEKITASGGYAMYYISWINVNALLEGKTWTFDFTSYNSNFTEDTVVTFPEDNLREGVLHASPYATQNSWFAAGNPPAFTHSCVEVTDDTFKINRIPSHASWVLGTYHCIIWKLG